LQCGRECYARGAPSQGSGVEEGNKSGLGGFQSLYALEAFLLTQVGLDDESRELLAQKPVASDLANGLAASTLVGDEAMAE